MKKFGLEFVLENKSKSAFSQIMDQQKRLEKQLNNTIKAFNKFQSSTSNNSFDTAVKKMDKLTESVKRYNNAVKNSNNMSLNSYYISDYHYQDIDFLVTNGYPIYFENIDKKIENEYCHIIDVSSGQSCERIYFAKIDIAVLWL